MNWENFPNKIFTNYCPRRTWVNRTLQAANISNPERIKKNTHQLQQSASQQEPMQQTIIIGASDLSEDWSLNLVCIDRFEVDS